MSFLLRNPALRCSTRTFATMTTPPTTPTPILEGVFAVNKPPGITSAQIVRDVVHNFTRSEFFKPWLASEQERRKAEGFRQRNRRNKFHKKVEVKAGHGGTLDPAATGVVVIGIGAGTKQLQGFIESRKSYTATVLFGAASDSYDAEGKILAKAPYAHITREKVAAALTQFRGEIKQRPPIFSALKMDGMALYEYARSGKELPREIALRPAKVFELQLQEWFEGEGHEWKWPETEATSEEVEAWNRILRLEESAAEAGAEVGEKRKRSASPTVEEGRKEAKLEDSSTTAAKSGAVEEPTQSAGPPAAKLTMDVGSGFYVRSLCHDLGKSVGSLALMAHLVRTRQGQFSLDENAIPYADLLAGEEVWRPKIEKALVDWNEYLEQSKGKTESKDELKDGGDVTSQAQEGKK